MVGATRGAISRTATAIPAVARAVPRSPSRAACGAAANHCSARTSDILPPSLWANGVAKPVARARLGARTRVRRTQGARRGGSGRLIRQMLAESLLLATIGGRAVGFC